MKRLTLARFLATAAVALGAFGAVTAAQARSDVYFSIGVQGAPVYVEPAPVYVEPQPVYVQPRPVYVPPPVYSAPGVVYVNPYDERRAWREAQWRRHNHWRHHREGEERHWRGRDWD